MALLGKAVIFPVGGLVWIPVLSEGMYDPKRAKVESVGRGRINIIVCDDGSLFDFSPNSRMLSLTSEECSCICRLMNREILK